MKRQTFIRQSSVNISGFGTFKLLLMKSFVLTVLVYINNLEIKGEFRISKGYASCPGNLKLLEIKSFQLPPSTFLYTINILFKPNFVLLAPKIFGAIRVLQSPPLIFFFFKKLGGGIFFSF